MNTSQFLSLLYGTIPHGYVEIRLIPESGDKRPLQKYRPMPLGTVNESALEGLHTLNQTHHVYHRIGISKDKKDSKAQIIFIPALWVDVDSTDGYKILSDAKCPPSLIVSSGKGFHGYWLLREPLAICPDNLAEVEQTLDGIAVACGGDRACKNINRILRTPGFKNIKAKYGDSAPLCEIKADDGYLYRYAELKRNYHALGADLMAIGRNLPAPSPNGSDSDLPKWVAEDYLVHGVSENRHMALFRAASWCRDFGVSEQAISARLAARAIADGLPAQEAYTTIASAYKKAQRLIVPNHMQNLMSIEDRI